MMLLVDEKAVLKIIEFEERWLFQVGRLDNDTEIAFNAIKSKINDLSTVYPTPFDLLKGIRDEIENNMESIIGIYDSSTPESEMPSCKIARNMGRQECIKLIDTKIKELGK